MGSDNVLNGNGAERRSGKASKPQDQGDGRKTANATHYPPLRRDSEASSVSKTAEDADGFAADAVPQSKTKRFLTWKKRLPPPIPTERKVSREYRAGILSMLIFQWMSPLISVGYHRPLEVNDIWAVNPNRALDPMTTKFKIALRKRQSNPSKLDPLLLALYDSFKKEFYIGGICQLLSSCLQTLTPFTLRYLIAFAQEAYTARTIGASPPPIGKGIGLVIGITCMLMLQSLCTSHFTYWGMMMGGQARSTLIACILEKTMKLSGRAIAGRKDGQPDSSNTEGWSNGRINNLMSTDTSRIDLASASFHRCWTAPIQILLTLALLCINLTYSALAGFAFVCLMVPLLARGIGALMRKRKDINKITDQRVRLTQEVLTSIRFVKFFSWEASFLGRLQMLRRREISKLFHLLSIMILLIAVAYVIPVFAAMLTFMTYKLSGHVLDAAPVFSSLALFNALNAPLEFLPLAIGQAVDASASITRISEFLHAEEQQDVITRDLDSQHAIKMEDASFTWEHGSVKATASGSKKELANPANQETPVESSSSQSQSQSKVQQFETTSSSAPSAPQSSNVVDQQEDLPFQIHDISMSVSRGELIAVIGSVGSGKSSLLSALAGEMRCTKGSVTFGAARRAFCPQYAWVQNASIKDNITFGQDFDYERYNAILDACALRPDLEVLPHGDLTEIGERGITISGGQKQRLNIARAIYFNADIVLMDDPLSAVDAHVSRHLMDEAICGLLHDKCRILATHQLHILHRVDRIVWMKAGKIYTIATFRDLMDRNAEFRDLMKTTAEGGSAQAEQDAQSMEIDEEQGGDSTKKKKNAEMAATTLMQQEERAVRSISLAVYQHYIQASGSLAVLPLNFILLAAVQGSNIVVGLWLSWWTSNRFPNLNTGTYIGIYAALGAVNSLLVSVWATAFTFYGTKASRVMVNQAMSGVLGAPISFFDTTPLGRLINRFSKDADTMDVSLVEALRFFVYIVGSIVAVFALTVAYYHYFAVVVVPLVIILLFASAYYRASAREIKRHEAVLRSVVFARFSEAVIGTPTIRAYGVQESFSRSLAQALDSMDGAYFLTFANQRWLAVRMDAFGNLLVFVLGILVVTSRFDVAPSIGGLVLSYMLGIIQLINQFVRQMTMAENAMHSTERVHHYGHNLEQESSSEFDNKDVPASWPERGEIVLSDVQLRYRPGLPLVLKGLSLHIQPGERIGIVGRTGAGKSTIATMLFRLVELASGNVSIDGVDIARIGLHDLRSRLAIIPQDPTLFRGTVRSNLDPFDEHQDTELWHALQRADLVDEVAEQGGRIQLDSTVEDEGLNFSSGQRQLLALARALVRDSRVILCDEATSSVDLKTDEKIQRMMLEAFKGRTLLCIAHRLKTIIGYDRILVMDGGKAAEVGSPLELHNRRGIFHSMCERSGITRDEIERGATTTARQ